MKVGVWWCIGAFAFACGNDKSPHSDGGVADAGLDRVVVLRSSSAPRELDLLFVIDDSPHMLEKQAQLATAIPRLFQPLDSRVGGLPSLHVGVVSTDMGTKGSAVAEPGPAIGVAGQGGCAESGRGGALDVNGAAVEGAFLADLTTPSGRIRNYAGVLTDVVAQMVRLGDGGCGLEQPLHAMQVALAGHPANVGFLRASAALAVIFLTTEDDCSITDPIVYSPDDTTFGPLGSFRCTRFGVLCTEGGRDSDEMNQPGVKMQCSDNPASPYFARIASFAEFLLELKNGEETQVVVGTLAGPPEPFEVIAFDDTFRDLGASCTDDNAEPAFPAVRLHQLHRWFSNESGMPSICTIANDPDPVAELGTLIASRVGGTCIPVQLADTDTVPGVQPDCIVEDVVGDTVTPIPPCESPVAPTCWELLVDFGRCPTHQNLDLHVVRADAPDPATVTNVRCLVP